MLISISVECEGRAALLIGGLGGSGFVPVSSGEPVSFPASGDGETVLTVWGLEPPENCIAVPRICRVRMEAGVPREANCPVTDWGGLIEISTEPLYIESSRPKRRVCAELQTGDRGGTARLVFDGEMLLELNADGAVGKTVPLGEGRDGTLRMIDFGFGRCITVKLLTRDGERICILSRDGGILLDAAGCKADIENGTPTVLTRLITRRGHERRTRWETRSGRFVPIEDGAGFFSHEPFPLENEREIAAALFEETALGLDTGGLMTPEFRGAAGEGGLHDYAGDFKRVVSYPAEEPPGRATVGLIREEEGPIFSPSRFLVSFSDGLVDDVTEL